MSTYGRGNPEVERVIAEMSALNATLSAATPAQAHEAQAMVRAVESQWPEPRTVADFAICAAMARITGSELPTGDPETSNMPDWAQRSFELVALAWLAWARGNSERARFWIRRWADEGAENLHGMSREGAVQAFSISLWANAVEGLIEGRTEDARRFFQRVYEVGSSFGTESHPTVLWTLAASFTPEG